MKMECALICQTCENLSVEFRCPVDPDAPLAWQPGDLNTFFVNITTLPELSKFEPHILSRPDYVNGDTKETADYQIGPWVVTLDNFVTDEEADRLIQLGAEEGYERSSDVGKMKFDGSFENNVNNGRTSQNAWCQNSCYNDTAAQQVVGKIGEITNIPEVNSEYLQLLRYEVGQYYHQHHDYIGFQVDRQPGVRIMTIFLYLNDVEAGGGTNFPLLDLTVMPKKGRALIWPSVLDQYPDKIDGRTDHQALKVEKGIKYGANAWVHQRDFKTPNGNGCQ
jgi:prolyl 4-hydroxylase